MLNDFPFLGFKIEESAVAFGLKEGNKEPGISFAIIYVPSAGEVSEVCVPEK